MIQWTNRSSLNKRFLEIGVVRNGRQSSTNSLPHDKTWKSSTPSNTRTIRLAASSVCCCLDSLKARNLKLIWSFPLWGFFATMAEQRKAVIKNADMSETMQQDAVDVASVALSKYNIEKVELRNARCPQTLWYCWLRSLMRVVPCDVQDVAAYIKKEFDKKHGPTW